MALPYSILIIMFYFKKKVFFTLNLAVQVKSFIKQVKYFIKKNVSPNILLGGRVSQIDPKNVF